MRLWEWMTKNTSCRTQSVDLQVARAQNNQLGSNQHAPSPAPAPAPAAPAAAPAPV